MTELRRKQIEEAAKKVNELVSDLAGCDRSGCRCWQAVSDLKTIRDFCDQEITSSVHDDLKTPPPRTSDEAWKKEQLRQATEILELRNLLENAKEIVAHAHLNGLETKAALWFSDYEKLRGDK